MKVTPILIVLVLTSLLLGTALAGHHGKHSLGKFDSETGSFRKHAGLAGVDKQIMKVINGLHNEIRSHEKAIQSALNHREEMKRSRKKQLAATKKEHRERIAAETNYNQQRKEEEEAEIALKKAETRHRAAQHEYKKVHKVATHAITQIDKEIEILNRIRELLGVHREGTWKKHQSHKDVKFNQHEDFNNYKKKNPNFDHGEQRFGNKKNGQGKPKITTPPKPKTTTPPKPKTPSKKFYIFTDKKRNMDEAQSFCKSKGMRVASVLNAEDYNAIMALKKTHPNWSGAWIDYRFDGKKEIWRWLPGGEKATITKWAPGEPNNVHHEKCTMFNQNGFWYNLPCNFQIQTICQTG